MPKNSLCRRHRQVNLLLLGGNHVGAFEPISRATPRQVSDEDITSNDALTRSRSNSSLSEEDSELPQTTLALKRALPAPPCLVEMTPRTPPSRLETGGTVGSCTIASSPWGHFVDLFVSDNQQAGSSSSSVESSTSSFVTRMSLDPYPLLKRRRVQSPNALPGFILAGRFQPRPSSSADSDSLHDALKGLSV